MKINEFAVLNESQVKEAPQGILKRTGLGIAKAFGSDKAAGKLETGKMANLIKKAFNKHLGSSGRESNAEELIKFLKINKYPTAGVEKMAQDMANKEKAKQQAKTMQKGPMAGDKQDGQQGKGPTAGDKQDGQQGNDDKIIQMPSQSDIRKFGGESVEEAELKSSQIDKLIMKAATDAYDVKSGYGGTGLGNLKGGGQDAGPAGGAPDDKAMQKALQRLRSETGITNANVAASALIKMAQGEQVPKQQREAVAPLLNAVGKAMADPNGVQRLLQLIKQTNKA